MWGMENAAVVVALGAVMIGLGMVRGLWDDLADGVSAGISNFSAVLRGLPAHAIPARRTERRREPLVALMGVAVVLLGLLARLSG